MAADVKGIIYGINGPVIYIKASSHRGIPFYFCMARSYANFPFTSYPS